MSGSFLKHRRMQKTLVERLKDTGYSPIYENEEYHVRIGSTWLHGETDVLAMSPQGCWHMYEIKSGKNRVGKATEQYHRFCAAHPDLYVKGVYVGADKVKRLK